MRKGQIFFVCNNNEIKEKTFDDIFLYLKDYTTHACRRLKDDSYIEVNGYRLIFCLRYGLSKRGYKPEIIYFHASYDNIEDIHTTMKMSVHVSHRKHPLRIFNDVHDINLLEILSDNYALENTIDKEKVKSWIDKNE